jgi:hypothetical protein
MTSTGIVLMEDFSVGPLHLTAQHLGWPTKTGLFFRPSLIGEKDQANFVSLLAEATTISRFVFGMFHDESKPRHHRSPVA